MSDVAKKNKQRKEKNDFGNYDMVNGVTLEDSVTLLTRLHQPHSSLVGLLTHRKGKLEQIFL